MHNYRIISSCNQTIHMDIYTMYTHTKKRKELNSSYSISFYFPFYVIWIALGQIDFGPDRLGAGSVRSGTSVTKKKNKYFLCFSFQILERVCCGSVAVLLLSLVICYIYCRPLQYYFHHRSSNVYRDATGVSSFMVHSGLL